MNTFFKNITFLLVAILMAAGNSNAQEVAMPANFKPFGKNSIDAITAWENTDSVAAGSSMQYWIEQDGTLPFAGAGSTFVWTVTGALGTKTAGAATNLATVTFTSTGPFPITGTITANETSPTPSCSSADVTPQQISVIALPDITTVSVANVSCQTIPFSFTSVDVTIAATCAVRGPKGIAVAYTITGPSAYSYSNTATFGNNTTLTITGLTPITVAGKYTITINSVTDRIATKCGLTAIAETATADFYVTPTPRTGSAKHVRNDAGW